jgi:hypothetical protein
MTSELPKGLLRTEEASLATLVGRMEAEGWRVFLLDGRAISDKGSFMGEVRNVMPLDPPLASDNWDALTDSLWNGLDGLDAKHIAIVWPFSEILKESSPQDYDVALGTLVEIMDSLADPDATGGETKGVTIVLGCSSAPVNTQSDAPQAKPGGGEDE